MQDRSVFRTQKKLPEKSGAMPHSNLELRGATFDSSIGNHAATFDSIPSNHSATLADLKKLQDQSKFQKARFSFKLYRRSEES